MIVALFSLYHGIIILSFILYLRFVLFCHVVLFASGRVVARVCNVARKEVCLGSGVEGPRDAPRRIAVFKRLSCSFLFLFLSFLARANSDNHSHLKVKLDQNLCRRLLLIDCTVRIVDSHVWKVDSRMIGSKLVVRLRSLVFYISFPFSCIPGIRPISVLWAGK